MATAPTLPSELLYFILSMYTSCAVDKLLVSSPQLGPTSSDTTRTVNAVSRIMNFMSSQLQPSEVMAELGVDRAILSLLASSRQLRAVTLRILTQSLNIRLSGKKFPLLSRPLATSLLSWQEWVSDSHNKFPNARNSRAHVINAYLFFNTSQHNLASVIKKANKVHGICTGLFRTLSLDSSPADWILAADVVPKLLRKSASILDRWDTADELVDQMSSEVCQTRPLVFSEKLVQRAAEARTEIILAHAIGVVSAQANFAVVCVRLSTGINQRFPIVVENVPLKMYLELRLLPELLAALVEMSRLLGGPSLGVLQENRAHKFCSRQNLENLADALLRLSTTGDVVPGVDFGECAAVAGKLAVQLREFTDNLPSPASESAPSKVSQV